MAYSRSLVVVIPRKALSSRAAARDLLVSSALCLSRSLAAARDDAGCAVPHSSSGNRKLAISQSIRITRVLRVLQVNRPPLAALESHKHPDAQDHAVHERDRPRTGDGILLEV